ncbi:MAG: hypothetical protein JK586_06750 [Nocardiopsis sp. BM-2018]|nr:MAG: hypothetical protein JK586_06750 [Nocardiopsis sp. BM-2018]
MYNGPSQQFPQQPQQQPQSHPHQGRPAPSPRRGGTGRTIGITLAATTGVYALIAGGFWLVSSPGAAVAGPEFEGLPTDPCSVPNGSQLNSVSARLASAHLTPSSSRCVWHVEWSDGSQGNLNVRYRFPVDSDNEPQRRASDVEREYEERFEQLTEGEVDDYWTVEVQESRELDVGEQAVVAHVREGYEDLRGKAEVLVLADGVLIDVWASETWDENPGRPDFTDDEDTLIAIAERAVSHLG